MMSAPRQNILFIFTDQMRADCMGCAGHPVVKTPHIDRLAAEGILFEQTYTTSPICVPARTSLVTERYPHQNGVPGNGWTVWPEAPSYLRQLRDTGYHTANWGKLHFASRDDIDHFATVPLYQALGLQEPHECGGKFAQARLKDNPYLRHLRDKGLYENFVCNLQSRVDRSVAKGGHCTTPFGHGPSVLEEVDHIDAWIMDHANAWLRDNAQAPFYFQVGPEGPHDPYDPPERWAALYDGMDMPPVIDAVPPGETNQTRRAREHLSPEVIAENQRQYYGNISLIDDRVGRLMDTLREKGLLENTWVIFSSDHGDHMGDFGLFMKVTFYDCSARIPLVIRPPDCLSGAPRGEVSSALVSLIDLATTMTDIAGAEPTPGGQGRSLLPMLSGRQPLAEHRDCLFSEIGPRRMILTREWKLVVNIESGEVIRLTHRIDDPEELRNLKDDAETVARLRREVEAPFLESSPVDMPPAWEKVFAFKEWPRNPVMDWQRGELDALIKPS